MKEVFETNPSGIFLSNGPGDPLATFKTNKKNLSLIKESMKPIFVWPFESIKFTAR